MNGAPNSQRVRATLRLRTFVCISYAAPHTYHANEGACPTKQRFSLLHMQLLVGSRRAFYQFL